MAKAIGIFDSGIGGLTIASAVKKQHPNRQIVYFGDTLHLPYGDKSSKSIQSYIKAIMAFLYEQGCADIVVACNSASSVLDGVSLQNPEIHLTNVIDPVVETITNADSIQRVGVIGTKRTIDSDVYSSRIKSKRPDIEVHSLATPLLAPMIEEGFIHGDIAEKVIHEYLGELPEIDALILGCTHYPLIRTEIDAFYDGKVKLFDAPDLVASALELHDEVPPGKEDHFYVSDLTPAFEKTAKLFFGERVKLEKSNLFRY